MRFWRSSVCGKVECMEPDADDYNVGDSEPCICGDLKCVATVEELEATVDDPRIHELLEHLVDDDEKGQGSHRASANGDEILLRALHRAGSTTRNQTPRGARKPRDAD